MTSRRLVSGLTTLVLAAGVLLVGSGGPEATGAPPPKILGHYQHVVVIYQENHSFDNLYGEWGPVNGQHVEGVADAPAARTTQVAQDGSTYACLRQNDVNLTSPSPLPTTCSDPAHGTPASAFTNKPFSIDDYIGPTDTTCPAPGASAQFGVLKGTGLPGGCTRDLVHRFYQEQYQLNGGRQNRYVTGSDAVGLTMGTYDTKALPIYRYLHRNGAPKYVIADRFFQGAFGGSFLNHQWLIAGRAPVDTSGGTFGVGVTNSVVDSNGMPISYPQYVATGPVVDGRLTAKCPDGNPADYARACGNFAVNTVQPASPPFSGTAKIPLIDDEVYPNIGDRMSDAGISWNWYSGGWDDAAGGHPGPLFQYHHQPFNYFADYAPGKPGRAHLQDETDFFDAAEDGTLPTVSFVKPYGAENEHPGYASATDGSDHLVKLIDAVMDGPQAGNTLIVVTYDEFGGQWDHVAPPGQGGAAGAHDAFGPGTRIPALLLSRSFTQSGVDHTVLDTTSIIATLERSLGLAPVGIRDTKVNDLANAVSIGRRGH
jgi:phospholipase C